MRETSTGPLPLDDEVVAKLLERANLARIAYIGLNGRPHVVPIWCQYKGGEIVMITGPKADKVPALQRNGAVAITIDSSTPPYNALLIDGTATVERTEGMAPEYPEIVRRYLGLAADAYLGRMRVKEQRRIRVKIDSWRVLDFVKRFPKSLR